MMETRKRPKKFILRRALVAAAVLAAAAALSLGVNAATGGELFNQVRRISIFLENGEKGEIYVIAEEDGELRMASGVKKANGSDAGKSVVVYEDADGKIASFELNPEEGSSKAP